MNPKTEIWLLIREYTEAAIAEHEKGRGHPIDYPEIEAELARSHRKLDKKLDELLT